MGIVAQTTFSVKAFSEIVNILLTKSYDIRILRTICTATDKRQSAAIKLSKEVDMMIVVGGRNSANTTRLAQLCTEHCVTHHIETVDELHDDWFNNIKKLVLQQVHLHLTGLSRRYMKSARHGKLISRRIYEGI